jgi:hypothetical protein
VFIEATANWPQVKKWQGDFKHLNPIPQGCSGIFYISVSIHLQKNQKDIPTLRLGLKSRPAVSNGMEGGWPDFLVNKKNIND